MTVDAFLEVLVGHFAFAIERGIDRRVLRADCDLAPWDGPVNPDHLFETFAAILQHLGDGHGSLSDRERKDQSRSSTSLLSHAWTEAGGRPLNGDFSNGLSHDWPDPM